jgi:hypothetical protein
MKTTGEARRHWTEIAPADAVYITLPAEGIVGPYTEEGAACPWPWEPQQLVGVPMGQFHCSFCGTMVVAGLPHPDYADVLAAEAERAEAAMTDDDLDGRDAFTCACGAPAALAVGYHGESASVFQCVRCATADPRTPFLHRKLNSTLEAP